MDYEYQITEGGIYTVKAFAPDDAANTVSNEVEVSAMTATVTEALVTGPNLKVSVSFTSNLVGTAYVCFKENAKTVADIKSGAYQPYPFLTGGKSASPTFNFKVSFDGPPNVVKLSGASSSVTELGSELPTIHVYFVVNNTVTELTSSSDITKATADAFIFTITPYTHELNILAGGNTTVGVVSTVYYKTDASWDEIPITTPEALHQIESDFGNNIVGASSVTFQIREDDLAIGAKALFDITELVKDYVVPVVSLGTPVLTYSATEGKLHWDEVEGADRYEVWKDGVKIADIPKKT